MDTRVYILIISIAVIVAVGAIAAYLQIYKKNINKVLNSSDNINFSKISPHKVAISVSTLALAFIMVTSAVFFTDAEIVKTLPGSKLILDSESKLIAAAENGDSLWTEVPMNNKMTKMSASSEEFYLDEIVNDYDYVFSGTVVGMKEYSIRWIDEKGEQWGPFPGTILDVKVNSEYVGKSSVAGEIVKIYHPYSLSTKVDGSVLIKENGEYVFITKTIDEDYIKNRDENSPEDNFQIEKYADLCLMNTEYFLMPVENDVVFVNCNYIEDDESVMKKILSPDSVKTDKLESPELLESGYYLALKKSIFKKAIIDLFDDSKEYYSDGKTKKWSKKPYSKPSPKKNKKKETTESDNISEVDDGLLKQAGSDELPEEVQLPQEAAATPPNPPTTP